MIAVVSVPAQLADTLLGRRITPFGAVQARRAYSLANIVNPMPMLGTAVVVWRDDDSEVIRWFHDDRSAVLWATADACRRSLERERDTP